MLTNEQDAFGHQIYDFVLGKPPREVVERDDGLIDSSPGTRAYFASYRQWPAYERKAIRFARGRVLDIGCGAGRVLLYLQDKGHECVGIDNSPLALRVCTKRGVKDVRLIPITQVSARLGTFDTIVMFGNNFGLFGSFKRAKWLLSKFHAITSARARIIASVGDAYATTEPEHLRYHRFNRKRGRMGGQLRLRVRYKIFKTPWFDYLFVSRDEMQKILAGTGWKVRAFIDSDTFSYAVIIEKDTV